MDWVGTNMSASIEAFCAITSMEEKRLIGLYERELWLRRGMKVAGWVKRNNAVASHTLTASRGRVELGSQRRCVPRNHPNSALQSFDAQ